MVRAHLGPQSPSKLTDLEGLLYFPLRNQALAYKAPPELYFTASLGGFSLVPGLCQDLRE